MQVTVHVATLTIEEKTSKLTKVIAKQLPIQSWDTRWDAARANEPAATPLCKVNGSTLGNSAPWLLLIQDAEAGLIWAPYVSKRTLTWAWFSGLTTWKIYQPLYYRR